MFYGYSMKHVQNFHYSYFTLFPKQLGFQSQKTSAHFGRSIMKIKMEIFTGPKNPKESKCDCPKRPNLRSPFIIDKPQKRKSGEYGAELFQSQNA